MNTLLAISIRRVVLRGSLATAAVIAAEMPAPVLIQTDSGTITFEATTNMPGIEVKGKSNALSAQVEASRESNRLILHRIAAAVAVNSLATGMKVRDEHMRKFIFMTADGQEPDVRFISAEAICEKSAGAREFVCPIAGDLSVRGVAKPLTLVLHAKEQSGNSDSFRAVADGTVKLSDYGIPAPSQFGVKPSDEVKIHIDFSARAKPVGSARVI